MCITRMVVAVATIGMMSTVVAEDLEILACDGNTKLTFGGAADGFSCRALDYGTNRFVTAEKPLGLWKLVFRAGLTGEQKIIDAAKLSNGSSAKIDNGLHFSWRQIDLEKGDGAIDVDCEVIWNERETRYEFRMDAQNRSKKFGLFSTEYPRIGRVAVPDVGSTIVPQGNWGAQRYRHLWSSGVRAFYPSYRGVMQFAAFEQNDDGVILHALDGDASLKYICVSKNFDFSIETPAEDAGTPGTIGTPKFAVALAPYHGEWWPAAKIYRKWAKTTKWMAKGLIAKRADFPLSIRKGGYWVRTGGCNYYTQTIAEAAKEVEMAIKSVNGRVPIWVYWTGWNHQPFDTLYPDYFPEREGFTPAAKSFVAQGVMIMPYLNGRIWDNAHEEFPFMKHLACLKENGEPYAETWNKRSFSAMCPSIPCWHNRMVELGDRLVRECGANALYYDQIASMTPVVCYATNHVHKSGGGSHWVNGYRQLLTKVREHNPGVPIVSENFSEPYIDLVDGCLTWSPNVPEDLPGIPAVYSGYVLTQTASAFSSYTMEAFRTLQGRNFLWGCQLGGLRKWIYNVRNRAKLEFMLRLIEIRQENLEFFADGELIGDVANRAKVATLKFKWNRWKNTIDVETPAVQAMRWRALDGREIVAVVNYADTPQRFDDGTQAIDLVPGDIKILTSSATK